MRLYHAKLIDLSIAILRAETRRFGEPQQSLSTRLALHVLRPYVDRHSLEQFWRICENPNPAQRVHLLKKLLQLVEASVARVATGD